MNSHNKPKVSIIIPTYNRIDSLKRAIESVKHQTIKDYELIIINDGSNQKEYNKLDFNDIKEKVNLINLNKNTKEKFGYPTAGFVRTVGMKKARGEYIAFLDDDDYWFPKKIEMQIYKMNKYNIGMSATNAYQGKGIYNKDHSYERYINCRHIYNHYDSKTQIIKHLMGFDIICSKNLINQVNLCITSTVVIKRTLLKKVNYMKNIPNHTYPYQDWDCWKRILEYTDCLYINKPLVFYSTSSN
jgi:glycosyltransferase involved in cell wall biosynthesis